MDNRHPAHSSISVPVTHKPHSPDDYGVFHDASLLFLKENYSMPEAKNEFYNSRKFEEIKRLMDIDPPFSEEIGQDEFLFEFMRTDTTFSTESEELRHLRSARAILGDEILEVYGFLEKKGLLDAYKNYRDN